MRRSVLASLLLAFLLPSRRLAAQETTPPAGAAPPTTAAVTTAEPAKDEPIPYRPIEGPVIINLTSVDVPKKGTLTVLFAHRFQSPVQGSSINNFFTFDDGADIGIGVGYAPIEKFSMFFYRYSNDNKTYELSGKYSLLSGGPFAVSLGIGGDFRTNPSPRPIPGFPPPPEITNRSTFFAQTIFAYTPFPWLRITAEPTYLNHTSGQPDYVAYAFPAPASTTVNVDPEPFYANVFNVPIAASVAITRSITLHAEIVPSYGRTVQLTTFNCGTDPSDPVACPTAPARSSPGVGWIVSVEKTLLRHRFAFTAGNLRETTMDQYLLPNFAGSNKNGDTGSFPKNIYLGFYLSRQWGLTK